MCNAVFGNLQSQSSGDERNLQLVANDIGTNRADKKIHII